jgi:hypothetical protein
MSFRLRLHRQLVKLLPPGDVSILNSLEGFDYDETLTDSKKLELFNNEIQRCKLANPSPIVALLAIENMLFRHLNTPQKIETSSFCIDLLCKILVSNNSSIPKHYYVGEWLSFYLHQGCDIEAQQLLEKIINATSKISIPSKQKIAETVLTSAATCWSSYRKPDLNQLDKIIAALNKINSHSLSTAEVWRMKAGIYFDNKNYTKAEECYKQSINDLNYFFKCDVTSMVCNDKTPGNGLYNAIIWHVYGGYVDLLEKTNRKNLANNIRRFID